MVSMQLSLGMLRSKFSVGSSEIGRKVSEADGSNEGTAFTLRDVCIASAVFSRHCHSLA